MAFEAPKSNENELYINSPTYSTIDFGNLFERIVDHFGEDSKLTDFTIHIEYIQTSGCRCCGHDSSDWEHYVVVTKKVTAPEDSSSKDVLLTDLINE